MNVVNSKSTSTVEESLITQAIGRDFLQYAKQYDIHDLARQVDSDAVNLIKEIKVILDNTALDDSECFLRIDDIVKAFYNHNLDTSRYWELE